MTGGVAAHRLKEGAVLGLPPILLLSALSRRITILSGRAQKAKSPDEPTEAITPIENPQST